ncbi:MAG TPA: tetraacyldisaccharide 4'-kinase [Vicinamibacterales bacterium]|nr:tetraacyldisaccharide 4'-kinase [Vicinamibacterales bacterium]
MMRVRRRRFERQPQRQHRLSRPVISVGNLSMGGTGKSPVVAALARWLIDLGHRPAILSRGYARADAVDGVVVVSDGTAIRATVEQSGDEPLMLARAVPGAIVCVSPDRYLSGVLAERQFGATVHILDDGFQHLRLARDLDILVTTIGEIPNGKVIPAGRLREPVDAAARAHLLVASDATAGAAASEAWQLGISQSCGAVRTIGTPVRCGGPEAAGGEPQAPVVAVAGIANPERFVTSLREAGWTVVDSMIFRDHHAFTRRDVDAIAAKVAATGASAVFTTDKDAVRFEQLDVPFALYRIPLMVTFDPPDAMFDTVRAVLV